MSMLAKNSKTAARKSARLKAALDTWVATPREPPAGIDRDQYNKQRTKYWEGLEEHLKKTGEQHPLEQFYQAMESSLDDPEQFFIKYAVAQFSIRFGLISLLARFNSARCEALDPQLVDQEVLRFLDPFLELASRGNAIADRLLRMITRRMLRRGELPPKRLVNYFCDRDYGKGPKLKQLRRDESRRDRHIVEVIRELTDVGCSAQQARSIVEKALARLPGHIMSQDALEQIWRRKRSNVKAHRQ